MPEPEMTPAMYGPDITFAGVPRTSLSELPELDIVFVGAPFDGGTSHRPGTRFGPQAIRGTDYLPHDASRPHLALGVDPLQELRVAGAVRGDRFLQIGLRGYWPEPPTLAWMAEQRMRSFEMTEVVTRGLDACLT